MSDSVIATATPYLTGAIGGMLLGALVALAIVLVVHARRRPRAPGSHASTPPVPARAGAGRWMTARYQGRCSVCHASIAPGDTIYHRPGATRCESCATLPAAVATAG